jgi:DNA polymerase III subunit gamma/tau
MSYEPLHHKYRPQTLADLVGQEAIAQTLSNALLSRKIAPAYLFTGPRGTGKTSSARIFAKSLNCLQSDRPTPKPCGECDVCRSIARGSALDVIEIDAASNTGVDNIREIIERAQFAPVQCRYKVYAIDECHMLSTAAFNALLKTLEEPPDRVIFILATTDPQRVLPTIISRCQRFDYRRIPLEAMSSHLGYIAREEKIDITEEAIAIIAQLANGGLRDAESLLDQLSLFAETIVPTKVWDLIGAVPEQDLLALVMAIRSDNTEAVIQQCRQILDRGKEPLIVLQNLANFYLNLLIAKTSPNRADLVAVTSATWQELIEESSQWQIELILQGQKQLKDSEVQLKNTTQPRLWLEITLLSLLPSANRVVTLNNIKNTSSNNSPLSQNQTQTTIATTLTAKARDTSIDNSRHNNNTVDRNLSDDRVIEKTIESNVNTKIVTVTDSLEPTQEIQENIPETQDKDRDNSLSQISPDAIWQKAIDVVVPPTTKELLRQQCFLISFDGSIAKIGIGSPQLMKLHQGKIANIEDAFSRICDRKIKAVFEVAKPSRDRKAATQAEDKKIDDRDNNSAIKTNEANTNYIAKSDSKLDNNSNNLNSHSPANNFVAASSANSNINTIDPPPKIIDKVEQKNIQEDKGKEKKITEDKVIDIQAYRKEYQERERINSQISEVNLREINGSQLQTKQSIVPEQKTERNNFSSNVLPTEANFSNLDRPDSEPKIDSPNLSTIDDNNETGDREDDNYSLEEIKKIAETFANFFSGEVINSE